MLMEDFHRTGLTETSLWMHMVLTVRLQLTLG